MKVVIEVDDKQLRQAQHISVLRGKSITEYLENMVSVHIEKTVTAIFNAQMIKREE